MIHVRNASASSGFAFALTISPARDISVKDLLAGQCAPGLEVARSWSCAARRSPDFGHAMSPPGRRAARSRRRWRAWTTGRSLLHDLDGTAPGSAIVIAEPATISKHTGVAAGPRWKSAFVVISPCAPNGPPTRRYNITAYQARLVVAASIGSRSGPPARSPIGLVWQASPAAGPWRGCSHLATRRRRSWVETSRRRWVAFSSQYLLDPAGKGTDEQDRRGRRRTSGKPTSSPGRARAARRRHPPGPRPARCPHRGRAQRIRQRRLPDEIPPATSAAREKPSCTTSPRRARPCRARRACRRRRGPSRPSRPADQGEVSERVPSPLHVRGHLLCRDRGAYRPLTRLRGPRNHPAPRRSPDTAPPASTMSAAPGSPPAFRAGDPGMQLLGDPQRGALVHVAMHEQCGHVDARQDLARIRPLAEGIRDHPHAHGGRKSVINSTSGFRTISVGSILGEERGREVGRDLGQVAGPPPMVPTGGAASASSRPSEPAHQHSPRAGQEAAHTVGMSAEQPRAQGRIRRTGP